MSCLLRARLYTELQLGPDTAGPYGQRVHGKSKMFSKLRTTFNFRSLLTLIVFQNQLVIAAVEFAEAEFQATEAFFLNHILLVGQGGNRKLRGRLGRRRQVVDIGFSAIRGADGLQKNVLGDDVAVVGGRCVRYCALFFEPSGGSVQCFVSQFIWRSTVPPVEIEDQAAANFEIALATGIDFSVQPLEELLEGTLVEYPVFLQGCPCSCRITRVQACRDSTRSWVMARASSRRSSFGFTPLAGDP